MKRKFSRIVGVGLAFMLLASLMVFAAPVSAATLLWGSEKPPSTTGNVLGPDGININDLAANGDTIYAATDDAYGGLYKSTNGGETWVSLESATSYPTSVDINYVAVAPDDPDVVIFGHSGNKVEYSSNGGSSFTDLLTIETGAVIKSIDVSAGPTRYVAVGGDNSTAPRMWTLKLAMAQAWVNRTEYPTATTTNFTANQDSVMAVKFSPNFATDKIITCVSGNDTAAYFQVFRYETGAYTWNGAITYYSSADWGTGVSIATLTSALTSASIALIPTYLGTDEGERVGFVGVATANEGGVVRLTDAYGKAFTTWSAGEEGAIHSVAYHDSGKLLAGDYDANRVYVCLTPMATTPKFERVISLKQPGGVQYTVVDWAGDTAVAGTSGDESAVAVSTDDGKSFNDIGLIDTALTNISDVGVSADGSIVYLASYDGLDASIWVRASSWTRVLSLKDRSSGEEAAIIRVAPDDGEAVYVAFLATQDVYVSKDSGKALWRHYPCYKVSSTTGIKDMAVEDAETVYAIDSAGCSLSTNSAASWGTLKPLDGIAGFSITLAPNGDILVGGSDGKVAFSTDGGSTFTATENLVGATSGNVRIVADADYADNNIIYASVTGLSLYRATATKTTTFTGRGPTLDTGHEILGLAAAEGLIYVLSANSTAGSKLWRNMADLATADTASLALWSGRSTTNEYLATPQALKVSDGPKFWAVDTTNDDLDSITDPIAIVGPTLKAPTEKIKIPVNPLTGRAYTITFAFERYPSKYVTGLQIQIATDDNFDGVVTDETVTVSKDSTAVTIGPFATLAAEYMPGYTYWWKVRTAVDGPMLSPWSEVRSFTVEEIVIEPPIEVIIPPAPPAPDITVEVPDVVVQLPPAVPAEPAIPTYMLWLIIGIGAVLIIALVVLIVRTRRVV